MTNPELTQMQERYEHLIRVLHTHLDQPDLPYDMEQSTERVDLYYTLRRQHGIHLDTRTNPWSWVTITPEEEEN